MDKELEDWYKLHTVYINFGKYETKDLADHIGVTPRTIQRWLKDKSKPDKEQLTKIKQYLLVQNQRNNP